MVNAHLLGIDWGTSNRRAYLLDRGGACIARVADDQGALAAGGAFPAALQALRERLGADSEVAVVMSGMVGSAAGWQEVPYLDPAVPLQTLAGHCVPVVGERRCAIVPGYRYSDGTQVDVMRGEEMQLLGVLALGHGDGCIVLPGTHSKWVSLADGRIERFATYMTGELFALLGKAGTLAALLADGVEDDSAFMEGLATSRAGAPLLNALFGVRASVVTGAMPAVRARSLVSGLLIGSEFGSAAAGRQAIAIVGADTLARRYALAAEFFGVRAAVLDPDTVYLAALRQFITRSIDASA